MLSNCESTTSQYYFMYGAGAGAVFFFRLRLRQKSAKEPAPAPQRWVCSRSSLQHCTVVVSWLLALILSN